MASSNDAAPLAANAPAEAVGEYVSEGNPFNLPSLEELEASMCDPKTSIVTKMANLFSIKKHGGPKAVNVIISSLENEKGSVLFRHEAAYVLGQLGSRDASARLEQLLKDRHEDEMVRHEAAEALSAIGSGTSLPVLEQTLHDAATPLPVRETCELAVEALKRKMQSQRQRATAPEPDSEAPRESEGTAVAAEGDGAWWERSEEDSLYRDPAFNTIDPSEPYPNCSAKDLPWLAAQLMNEKEKLWNRYRALFTLRNLDSSAAMAVLSVALARDTSSALLRHEIAFVLGQLRLSHSSSVSAGAAEKREDAAAEDAENEAAAQRDCAPPDPSLEPFFFPKAEEREVLDKRAACVAVEALADCLQNAREHPMARHEAALALGSLGASPEASDVQWKGGKRNVQEAVIEFLQKYRNDPDRVVSESCLVGLDCMQDELGLELGVY
ncbi:HEAT repeat-containing protein [Besnoitia besnoiti]|uniref:Deoxyhypusine hydroxylase n=1 Tax=Besnoitia besnoiti TaxID=94643 RepID=A0A2A9M8U5_BESBE|nr:HEAT repeat-containing protein [Besnoitia besnoiti]PFH32047.1 HEAT repeat-containing protein [Besnoitia besnoiti]